MPDASKGSPEGAYLRKSIASDNRLIAKIEADIRAVLKSDARLGGLVAALAGTEGVGELTAAKVAALMPELGTLGRRRAASLAGLAPVTRQSGRWRGQSRIGGGRSSVRTALYMSALVAARHNPVLREVYTRLVAKGKKPKLALTAVMRRLIVRLDAVAKAYYAGRGGCTGA
jgi:transposase